MFQVIDKWSKEHPHIAGFALGGMLIGIGIYMITDQLGIGVIAIGIVIMISSIDYG